MRLDDNSVIEILYFSINTVTLSGTAALLLQIVP